MRNAGLIAILLAIWISLSNHQTIAGEIQLEVEIPQLNVSEYHRPYVAIWIQNDKQQVVANLAAWYQMKSPSDKHGHKWLPDLRQWWRRSGRSLELPVDGVSGATRHVGPHTLSFDENDKQLSKLVPGKYTLFVEAAREVGGRELLELKFDWPASKSQTIKAQGKSELGAVTLKVLP